MESTTGSQFFHPPLSLLLSLASLLRPALRRGLPVLGLKQTGCVGA